MRTDQCASHGSVADSAKRIRTLSQHHIGRLLYSLVTALEREVAALLLEILQRRKKLSDTGVSPLEWLTGPCNDDVLRSLLVAVKAVVQACSEACKMRVFIFLLKLSEEQSGWLFRGLKCS